MVIAEVTYATIFHLSYSITTTWADVFADSVYELIRGSECNFHYNHEVVTIQQLHLLYDHITQPRKTSYELVA